MAVPDGFGMEQRNKRLTAGTGGKPVEIVEFEEE